MLEYNGCSKCCSTKNGYKYYCGKCDYYDNKKSNFKMHLLTKKHRESQKYNGCSKCCSNLSSGKMPFLENEIDMLDSNINKNIIDISKNSIFDIKSSSFIEKKYKCICGKQYLHRSSLYNHKKICNQFIKTIIDNNDNIDNNENLNILTNIDNNENLNNTTIKTLLDNNNKLLSLLINEYSNNKMQKNNEITNTNNQITNNQNTNNQITNTNNQITNTNNQIINTNQNNIDNLNVTNNFNINLFLNETCKDAININDFVESIKINVRDLIKTKEAGLVDGITNIFIENMDKLPLKLRPIHCTDVKRETIYIKNEIWEKDTNNKKTKEAIKNISKKQAKNMNKYKDSNPDYMTNDKKKEEYIDIVKNVTSNLENNENKILKNICKYTYIDDNIKNNYLLL